MAQRRVALDARVSTLLPDSLFEVRRTAQFTVAGLLTHTAGLGDLVTSPAFRAAPDTLASIRQLVALMHDDPAVGPVGPFRYGDDDYVLLGAIIERITGQAFADALDTLVFAPAGMSRSGFHVFPRPAMLARGYTTRHLGTVQYANSADAAAPLSPNDRILPHVGVPGAVAYTTAEDLLHFADALYSGRLLPPAERGQLWSGHVATGQGAQNPANAQYGFGFFVGTVGADSIINHGGTGPGIDVVFDVYPRLRRVFVVLANQDAPGAQRLRGAFRAAVAASSR